MSLLLLSSCAPHVPAGTSSEPGPGVTAAANGDVHLSVREVVRLAAKSVVVVRTPYGLGSGFVVEPGLVATNLHVIAGADRIGIAGADGKPRLVSAVIAVDAGHDLALVAFDAAPNLPPLPLGHGLDLVAGDPVVALGTPQGLALSASSGIVSAVRRVTPSITLVQTTTPISPGSSGGPLLDDAGRVVAVTTLFAKNGQNVNFAVPVEYVTALMEHRDPPVPVADFAKLKWSRDQGLDHARSRSRRDPWGAPRNAPPFPASVAGFRMGSTEDDARAACPGKWSTGKQRGRCAVPPVELPFATGAVELFFANGRLLSVVMPATAPGAAEAALSSKYGAPSEKAAKRTVWTLAGGNIVIAAPSGKNSPQKTPYIVYTANPPDVEANY
jgi:hypothetical protein